MSCTHARAIPSTEAIPGHTVWACRDCRQLSLDDTGEWIPGGAGWLERLKAKAGIVERELSRDEQARYSPISDARWTEF